jgi:hypothetical protein
MTNTLRRALDEAAAAVPPVRLPPDLWRRGRRSRRRRRWAAVGAAGAAVVLAVALALQVARPGDPTVGRSSDAVPAELHLPWMWQATVQQAPAGPASVIFGGYAGGLRGEDHFFDHEGKVAIVGRGGSYRMLLYGLHVEMVPGQNVALSPDGSAVAQGHLDGTDPAWIVVTDLATGRSAGHRGPDGKTCCGEPVAWAPDGRSLLVLDFEPATSMYRPSRLAWLDLTTGAARVLVELGDRDGLRPVSLAAFSPDGRRVAVSLDDEVRLLDLDGRTLWRTPLGAGRYLAGTAAFTPDGRRIATVAQQGCRSACDSASLAARRWRVGYLDAGTGTDAIGPELPAVTGMTVRAIGWRHGTDLVALAYRPVGGLVSDSSDTDYYNVDSVTLLALRPDGVTETLLRPPAGVVGLDLARDLVDAGRFGGPAPAPAVFPARWVIVIPLLGLGLPALAVGLLLFGVTRRLVRRRAVRPG